MIAPDNTLTWKTIDFITVNAKKNYVLRSKDTYYVFSHEQNRIILKAELIKKRHLSGTTGPICIFRVRTELPKKSVWTSLRKRILEPRYGVARVVLEIEEDHLSKMRLLVSDTTTAEIKQT